MAKNVKNKFPADKTGTPYAAFRNTKRVPPGKVKNVSAPARSGANEPTQAPDSQKA